MSVKILHGDCRNLLKTLPDESVHCVVTSPPYYGLREYKLPPTIWGGSAECEHDWGDGIRTTDGAGFQGKNGERFDRNGHEQREAHRGRGQWCARCGAWRGDLGLEPDWRMYLEHMVQVFREVHRVLRKDGTLWLNMGDSYATGAGLVGSRPGGGEQGDQWAGRGDRADAAGKHDYAGLGPMTQPNRMAQHGFKPKDLMGMPWRVALALQEPYYTGRIKNEKDRVWLAAMIDAEGCMFIHRRKAGTPSYANYTKTDGSKVSYTRTQDSFGVGLEVANTSDAVVQRCLEIVGRGSICSQSPTQNNRRKQTILRWNMRTNECRDVIREVYPYLVAKQQQARIILGCPTSGDAATAAHQALIGLHRGIATDVDYAPPAPMFEQGWFLRQDVIWKKPNPMPESVQDRCTKSHEYLFLLSKSERYFFDQEAIMEEASANTHDRLPGNGMKMPAGWDTGPGTHGSFHRNGREKGRAAGNKTHKGVEEYENSETEEHRTKAGLLDIADIAYPTRNKRSVWTVATAPFKDAHFATFPPALIEPCILAGCPRGGIVLDPFGGAGTTGLVADRLQRNAILIELNETYAEMARARLTKDAPLLAEVK